jgi:PPOX class probable FMN-dependent enzyme
MKDAVGMRREVNTVEELRAIVGHPNSYAAHKVGKRLTAVQQDWLAHSPLGFVATTDAQGRVDVSPKGDPPGFVHVIDDTTIAIPERPGNKRVDGYLNVLERPHVGTLFLIPGRGDTLRVNGTARVLADADYFDAMTVKGKRPILALEIDVEEVFFHCAKAFLRSETWDPSSWNPTAVPSVARIAQALKKDMSLAELEKYYSEDNMRSVLY